MKLYICRTRNYHIITSPKQFKSHTFETTLTFHLHKLSHITGLKPYYRHFKTVYIGHDNLTGNTRSVNSLFIFINKLEFNIILTHMMHSTREMLTLITHRSCIHKCITGRSYLLCTPHLFHIISCTFIEMLPTIQYGVNIHIDIFLFAYFRHPDYYRWKSYYRIDTESFKIKIYKLKIRISGNRKICTPDFFKCFICNKKRCPQIPCYEYIGNPVPFFYPACTVDIREYIGHDVKILGRI